MLNLLNSRHSYYLTWKQRHYFSFFWRSQPFALAIIQPMLWLDGSLSQTVYSPIPKTAQALFFTHASRRVKLSLFGLCVWISAAVTCLNLLLLQAARRLLSAFKMLRKAITKKQWLLLLFFVAFSGFYLFAAVAFLSAKLINIIIKTKFMWSINIMLRENGRKKNKSTKRCKT